MKLHEEFKLYENMWDDTHSSEVSTENRYIILTGDFPNKYYVHGLTSDGEKEAVDIYNKAMAQLPNFDCDIEVAELFDLTSDEISRLEFMVGKEVTGADADFISDFFIDGSRVDSRYNNFTEALHRTKQIVYVLSTFDGDEYVYDNFYKAVDDAENKYCTEANSVYPYYLNDNGTYTEMVPDGVEGCLCWTEEEGIIEEALMKNLQENSNLNTHRNMKMYCVEVGNDASEFELRFEVNGKIVDRVTVYSFDDVLIVSAEFFKRNCEKVSFDTRFDRLEIKLDYTYYGA
jgi:hypothetical protein